MNPPFYSHSFFALLCVICVELLMDREVVITRFDCYVNLASKPEAVPGGLHRST